MKLNLPTHACDAERLESFLSGGLGESEEREFTLHLNSCESCRRSLAEQAAEPEAWREAELLLKPSQFDSPSAAELATQSARPLQIQNVLDALGPTDDPQMLGRLGGYEVSGVVGAGGMGVVLKAIDQSLDRTVAIKVLAPYLASSGAARKRFAREAKAAAAVLHPNVIAIHSVSNDEKALPYLVMPYVRGTSLQKRLDREGPLPLQEILRIAAQIAAGLAAAHAQGLVHRDIKPANILLEEGVERVTITDFGLARAVDDATITHSGMIAGTPQYMSPEQARGEAVDPRSDLFSLGSVLYAICTGRPPFRAETSYGVMRRITDDESTAIRDINPEIPQWLCQIIGKLMSKRADDRYASAAEVAELLEQCLAHLQQPTVAKLPPSLQPAQANRFSSISRRRTGVIAMIAAFGLSLLGFLAWQATEAPDIAGKWTGPEWGEVVITATKEGEYEGTYTDTFKENPGTIEVKWSRLERRYKGTWREGQERSGKISLRLVDNEIRGAWTTSKKSGIHPGTPELADLTWRRSSAAQAEATPGIRVRVLLNHERHSREMLRDNVGFDQLSIMADGIRGSVSGKPHENIQAVMAHGCRLESFEEAEVLLPGMPSGKKCWSATLFVPQDSKGDGANLELSQERLDGMLREGARFWLDHRREELFTPPIPDPGTPELADWRGSSGTGIQLLRGDEAAPAAESQARDPAGAGPKIGDAKSGSSQFSETKELVLSMDSLKFMLDLDTGKTMDPPQTARPEQKQMDIQTDQVQPYHYPKALIGLGLQGMEVKESDWNASAADVRRALAGKGVEPLKEMDQGPEKHPTYFFKTRDGAQGVLQLLEVVDKPKGMRLRYKTIMGKPDAEQRGEALTPKQIVKNGQKLSRSGQRIVVRMKVAANKPVTLVDEKGSQHQHWNLFDAETEEFSIRITNDGQKALLQRDMLKIPHLFVGEWIEVEGTVHGVARDIVSRPDTTWTYYVDLDSLDQLKSIARIDSRKEEIRNGDRVATEPEPTLGGTVELSSPMSEQEKAVAKLVLVFFDDKSRRAVPCLVLNAGGATFVLTAGPATVVPDGTGHAVDRAFIELAGKEQPIPVEHDSRSTAEFHVYRTKDPLDAIQLKEAAAVNEGDSVTAVSMSRVAPQRATVVGLGRQARFELPDHKVERTYEDLIEVDERLPEGTPLFKNGKLVGVTLLGTRYVEQGATKSYVVPAARLVELCEHLGKEKVELGFSYGFITELQKDDRVDVAPLGSDIGLRVGDTGSIYRDKVYLGKVTFERVLPKTSVARIESREGEIRRGDLVLTEPRSKPAVAPQVELQPLPDNIGPLIPKEPVLKTSAEPAEQQ